MRRLTYKCPRGILVESSFEYDLLNGVCYQDCVDKLGSLEDIEKCANIPFAKISSLKVEDVVYFKIIGRILEGKVSNINYEDLTITVLYEETFIDFMLFHQYGKDRPPVHCWSGAWALTKEELK